MKRSISLMALAVLLMQGCNISEPVFEPDTPQGNPYKVQIYNDIFQQPASRVTTDGFCTGDEVGVYIVNYDGETPGTLNLKGNQADNVRFAYNENGDWVSDYDVFYKEFSNLSGFMVDGYVEKDVTIEDLKALHY